MAGVRRRGDSHEHVPRSSGRLRDGAGANPRDRPTQTSSRAAALGLRALDALRQLEIPAGLRAEARGLGLLLGLELRLADGAPATAASLAIIKALLHRGFILLPEGEHANVISFTPPLTITWREFAAVLRALQAELHRVALP